MRFAKPQVFASAVLVSWACAKAPSTGDDDYTPPGTTGGRGGTSSSHAGKGGSSASPGSGGTFASTGGSSAATGGTSETTGGSSGTGGDGTGGSNVSGGAGGTSPSGGRSNGTGGSAPAGGRSATGGTNATGGSSGTGGDGAGGVPAMGGATNGGANGAAGVPSDPNWKPPDMTATAKLLVLYQAAQTAPTSTDVRMTLTLKNQTDTPYDLSAVTMRYWMSSEPPPKPAIDYSSAGLKLSSSLQFVPNSANSYLKFTFGKGGVVPPSTDPNAANDGQIQARVNVDANVPNNPMFNEANDWSFDKTATAAKPNPKMTIYDGNTLIWGCEPSHVCASTATTGGEAGGGGQGGAP